MPDAQCAGHSTPVDSVQGDAGSDYKPDPSHIWKHSYVKLHQTESHHTTMHSPVQWHSCDIHESGTMGCAEFLDTQEGGASIVSVYAKKWIGHTSTACRYMPRE